MNPRPKPLSLLLERVPHKRIRGDLDVAVQHVVSDSRQVKPGDVFVCLPGYRAEGGEMRADRHEFAGEAVDRGAVAVVVERELALSQDVTQVRVADAWQAIAEMACAAFDHPSRSLQTIGVTGTAGKTSTTYFIESILRHAGRHPARLGTIEYHIGDTVLPAAQTTPEAPELQRLLRLALDHHGESVVMEVSSHALALQRVGGVEFDVGVFTNLSQDHLNFHPDMEHYKRAKGRLFETLGAAGKQATAVVNSDDPACDFMLSLNRGRAITFGVNERADVRAVEVASDLAGTRFTAVTAAGRFDIDIPHLGEFHVHNSLAALATGVALGIDPQTIVIGLATAPAVPGRFELVDAGQDFRVAVDYAHKPDALERLLRGARGLRPRRLITVFGCGGDRDRGKRPIMGSIAARLSDRVIVTSDNPRGEAPDRIVDQIIAGARDSGGAAQVSAEVDRAMAIETAIREAQTGDLVLIAGKGHETYQLFDDHRIHFDDREVARQALRRRFG